MASTWLTYNGNQLACPGGSIVTVLETEVPEYTVRVQFTDTNYVPTSSITSYTGTWTAVDSSQGIWDWYANVNSWCYIFNLKHSIIGANNYAKVLSANVGSNVTDISYMFDSNDALTEVHNFRSSADLIYVYTNSIFRNCQYLTYVQIDMSGADTIREVFQSCTRLTYVDIKTTNTLVIASYAFSNCSNLVSAPQLVTDNVTNMSYMFSGCTALSNVPNYNTSSCTNMSYMFRYCSNLTTVPMLDMGNATDTTEMYRNCTNLTSATINPHKAASLGHMFDGCSNLTSVTVYGTQSQSGNALVTNYMFYGCGELTSITGFINTGSVTDMSLMFWGCELLTAIPDMITTSCTNMDRMLYNCKAITSVPYFDTGNVTNFNMFMNNCWNVTSLPLFDTHSATTLYGAFRNCNHITAVPLLDTSSVTDMSYAFYLCLLVESGALALYQQASTQTNVPSEYTDCFFDCGQNTPSGLQDLMGIPASWGGLGE